MIYSIYEELLSLTTSSQQEVKDRLAAMGIAHIFAHVVETHWDKNWLRPIVQYAAHIYCWESKAVRIGADWKRTKLSIAEKVGLPDEAYDDVVHLKDERMAECFSNFLFLYKENMDYVHMTSLKEIYQQVMTASRLRMDKEGNSQLEEKFADLKKASALKEEIKEIEEELEKKYKITKVQSKDFEYDHTAGQQQLKLENSPFIR